MHTTSRLAHLTGLTAICLGLCPAPPVLAFGIAHVLCLTGVECCDQATRRLRYWGRTSMLTAETCRAWLKTAAGGGSTPSQTCCNRCMMCPASSASALRRHIRATSQVCDIVHSTDGDVSHGSCLGQEVAANRCSECVDRLVVLAKLSRLTPAGRCSASEVGLHSDLGVTQQLITCGHHTQQLPTCGSTLLLPCCGNSSACPCNDLYLLHHPACTSLCGCACVQTAWYVPVLSCPSCVNSSISPFRVVMMTYFGR